MKTNKNELDQDFDNLNNNEILSNDNQNQDEDDFIENINLTSDNQVNNIMNSITSSQPKKQKEKKQQNNFEAQFSGRFTDPEDVGMFYRWKKELEKNGKTVYKELNNVIRSYLLANEKKEIMRDWKHDLFQALRKVSWSALSPYQLQINRRFRSMDIEMSIINLKLNMIINALFKDNGDLEKQIDNPGADILAESKFFERTIRGAVNKLTNDWTKKMANKIQNSERAWNDFLSSLSENEFDDILQEIGATNSTAQEQIEEK